MKLLLIIIEIIYIKKHNRKSWKYIAAIKVTHKYQLDQRVTQQHSILVENGEEELESHRRLSLIGSRLWSTTLTQSSWMAQALVHTLLQYVLNNIIGCVHAVSANLLHNMQTRSRYQHLH